MTEKELRELKAMWECSAKDIYYDPEFYSRLQPHIETLLYNVSGAALVPIPDPHTSHLAELVSSMSEVMPGQVQEKADQWAEVWAAESAAICDDQRNG